jgi:hypothetical protein
LLRTFLDWLVRLDAMALQNPVLIPRQNYSVNRQDSSNHLSPNNKKAKNRSVLQYDAKILQ